MCVSKSRTGVKPVAGSIVPRDQLPCRLELGLRLQQVRRPIHRVVFGDLHLEHVRSWRETHLGPALLQLGLRAHFPLWQRPYPELRNDFFNSGAAAVISAVASEHLEGTQIGFKNLPLIGPISHQRTTVSENGEYHTLVCPPDGMRLLANPWCDDCSMENGAQLNIAVVFANHVVTCCSFVADEAFTPLVELMSTGSGS